MPPAAPPADDGAAAPATSDADGAGSPAGRSGWLRADLRAAPLAVWAAVLLHLLVLLTYTTLQPAYRGLDEVAHVDMVLAVPNPLDWPAPGEKLLDDRVRATWDDAGVDDRVPYARLPRREAQLPRSDRPSFTEAGTTGRDPGQNQMVQHPPLYYALAALGLHAVPGTEQWPFDRQVWLMRALSALMIAPLPLLCWLAARRLALPSYAAVAAALVPLALPSVQRIGGSVSNDGLLVLLVATANVLAIAVAAGDLRRRTAAALGLVSLAALLTKGFALVLPFVVAGAYLVAAWRLRSWRPVLPPALLAAALVALAAPWYLRNLLVFGAVQPNGYRGGDLPFPRSPGEGVEAWLPKYLQGMSFRFWSSLGLPDLPALPHTLSRVLTVSLLVLLVLALVVARGRRLQVAVALLPLAGLLAVVTLGSYVNYMAYDRMIGVQGRYLYPALAGIAAVAVLTLTRLLGPAARVLPVAVLAGAGWLQFLAGRAVMKAYWTPGSDRDDLVHGYGTLVAWSPLPDAGTHAVWVAAGAGAVAAVVTVAAAVVRPQPAG
jgi:small subunit ribosomal protein S36